MPNENLATLRDPINPEVGRRPEGSGPEGSSKLEAGGEMSPEAAGQEMQTEVQRQRSQIEELGKALPDDPEAQAATQATLTELEGVRQKYSKQLDAAVSSEEPATLIREPAKVYDFQEEVAMRESLRAERLRKRMEHGPKIETSPLAQSVRVPEIKIVHEPTLRSAEFGEPTLREAASPTLQEVVEIPEEALPAVTDEDIIKEEPKEPQSEKVLKATQEGLKELSADDWSDLYQQSDLAWTPEIWKNLSDQAPANDNSEREQLRRLAINKAEMALKLIANAAALHELSNLVQQPSKPGKQGGIMSMQEQLQGLQQQVPDEKLRALLLEQRKLEQSLAQDKAKEKQLFEKARERSESLDVDVSEFAVARINKPPSGYTDEELERIAKESVPKKSPSKAGGFLKHAGKSLALGGLAVGLVGIAKLAGYILSGKAAFKVLDWIDKGMEKIQKYAFRNDFSGIFDMAKDAGAAIHKKIDGMGAKEEKKEE